MARSIDSTINNKKFRGIFFQLLLILAIVSILYVAATNAIDNLRRARIASGFDFLNVTAGFDIGLTLIEFSAAGSTYGEALLVGLLNTLLVSAIGIAISTVLGFAIGIGRLSPNWAIAKVAMVYVEFVRNVPLLVQLMFWYVTVLGALPHPRNSYDLGGGFFLNARGLFLPRPHLADGAWILGVALLAGAVMSVACWVAARRMREETGKQFPGALVGIAALCFPLALSWALLARSGSSPVEFETATKGAFNMVGGVQVLPEFIALLMGLSAYTAAFIAEVVRAGIIAVPKGQTEAALSTGLSRGKILRLVVIPQAMRIIIPPTITLYINLIKNSSLAVAIGYPDLVQVFMGTVANQTGQVIEAAAITMTIYLLISIALSALLNFYNKKFSIVER